MKRALIPLLSLALLLALAACGTAPTPAPSASPAPPDASAPAPTAPPAPSPAPTEPPAPSLFVKMGGTAAADLDGDGREETLRVWLEADPEEGRGRVRVELDGADLSRQLYPDDVGNIVAPAETGWFVTDIDRSDGVRELAILDLGPSDDLFTWFYRYEDGVLRCIGGVCGLLRAPDGSGDAVVDGSGAVHSYLRLQVLQSWSAAADYAVEDGRLAALVPEGGCFTAERPNPVTLLTDLTAYDRVGAADTRLLPEGTALTLTGTDNAEWIRCAAADGGVLWLRLNPENPYMIESPGGYLYVWAAMDGLLFAD